MIYRRDWKFFGIGMLAGLPLALLVAQFSTSTITIEALSLVVGLFVMSLIERDERRTGARARIRENRRRSDAQASRSR